MKQLNGSVVAATLAAIGLYAVSSGAALASQGPGIASGTASAVTQLGMAVLVYGLSAAILAVGLIGALRQR
jgi:hypothetical protein